MVLIEETLCLPSFSLSSLVGMLNHPPIPISELADHTEHLKANDNLKLSQEYEVWGAEGNDGLGGSWCAMDQDWLKGETTSYQEHGTASKFCSSPLHDV